MEADRVKTAFLHNVTDRIVPPIERIKEDSDNLIVNFQNLPQEEIARLVDEIDKDSAIVTDLLDQLIEVSLRDSGNEHYSKQS
jgi:methyl-accepting chemotaxis protein